MATAPLMARDPLYEEKWLAELETVAEQRFSIPTLGYADRVRHRLAVGAERYGDEDFLVKDMLKELMDETPDVASHALLEVQKQLAHGGLDDSRAWHLFEAALHGCAADYHARMARHPD